MGYDSNTPKGPEGGPRVAPEKPMDQPKGKYTVNEKVPRDSFQEESAPSMDAPTMDKSKKFPC